jgi:hypothetical protein
MTSKINAESGMLCEANTTNTWTAKSPELRITSSEADMLTMAAPTSKVHEIQNSNATARKLSPRRKLKKAIQSGTKAALSVKTDLFYSSGMTGVVSPATRIKQHYYKREWQHRQKKSSTSISMKEKCSFAFKERTFVCLQIPNKDGIGRIVFLRIGPCGHLLMVPYPLDLTGESAKIDPVHAYFNSEGDVPAVQQKKRKRLQNVIKGIDKMGSFLWIPVGTLEDINHRNSHNQNIETKYENRLYKFQMKNNEQKRELYNRVRFEMQITQRQQVLTQAPDQISPVNM